MYTWFVFPKICYYLFTDIDGRQTNTLIVGAMGVVKEKTKYKQFYFVLPDSLLEFNYFLPHRFLGDKGSELGRGLHRFHGKAHNSKIRKGKSLKTITKLLS